VIYGLGGVGKTQITVRFVEENPDLCVSCNASKWN
jgi:GTPase SAR1 family protein